MNRLFIIFLFFLSFQIHAQKFMSNNGEISFFSEAPLENIAAINNKVSAIFDSSTNDLAFQLRISDLVFPNSLMQEHFNENYLESDIYPESTFLGKVVNTAKDKWIVEGNLKIHGKINQIKVMGVVINKKGLINISAKFNIKLIDYGIKIPKIVMYKIAEEIDITVNIQLKEVK